MAGEREPLHDLSANDQGPIVVVVCYCFAVTSIVFACTRFLFALTRKTPLGLDDVTYVLANVGTPLCRSGYGDADCPESRYLPL
jgi:hypothetical protein